MGHSHQLHLKKDPTSLYFLRQLRKFNLPLELLKQFYSAIIESVLCTSITVWFGSATKSDIRRLQRTVQTAERIIGAPLLTLQELYTSRVWKRAQKISLDPSHPSYPIFFTFAIWPVLQSPKYQDSQAQEQFLSPGNLPYEVKCSPHYAIKMCNNLIFICYHLHPSTSLYLILFYCIL